MGKRGKTVREEKRKKVIELWKAYSVPYIAQHLDLSRSAVYKILRQERKRPLHYEELMLTSFKLARNLERWLDEPLINLNIGRLPGTESYPVGKLLYGGLIYGSAIRSVDKLADIDKAMAGNVLVHLKAQYPILADLKDFGDLTDDDFTREVIDLLKVSRQTWKGRCGRCPR